MLFDLVKTFRGKESVVMTGELSKVNDRMKQLRSSQRNGVKNQRVLYTTRPAAPGSEKYKEKPHNLNLSGDRQIPRVPRK